MELPIQHPKKPSWHSMASTVLIIILAPLIAIFLTLFVFQSYQVDGQSMETTLQNNDRLIVNKLPRSWSRLTHHAYVPHRGQIIIFNEGGLPGYSGEKQLIKRVIGLPGDRVVVKNNAITIYNSAHPQGFNPDKSLGYKIDVETSGDLNMTLASDQLFVCGDNRPSSEDSRYFGPIKLSQVVGKLSFRILPLGKFEHF